MKKGLILFLFLSLSVFATDISNPFMEGNDHYVKGNYEAAIANYESILARGQQSAELYFNLGNSYYKLHKVAPAIYNYEKALLLNPDNEEVKTNLEFAQKLKIDDIKEFPKVGFSKLIQDVTSSFNYDSWAWISIVFAFAFLAFFVGYYFSNTAILKRIYFTAMFVVFILIVGSVTAGILEKNRFYNDKPAIVFAEITLLKNQPYSSGKTLFTLHEGTKVAVLETKFNWKKVQLTDETVGWIVSDAIKELK